MCNWFAHDHLKISVEIVYICPHAVLYYIAYVVHVQNYTSALHIY